MPEGKERKKKIISVYADRELARRVAERARAERRPVGAMARVILEDAVGMHRQQDVQPASAEA